MSLINFGQLNVRKLLILILLFFFAKSVAFSNKPATLNIGVKIGVCSPKHGGFFIGPEISYCEYLTKGNYRISDPYFVYGVYFNIDFFMNGKTRINLGLEGQYMPFPGLCIGLSKLSGLDSSYFGFNFLLYHGLLLYPYIGYSIYPGKDKFFEAGTFLKYPFMLNDTRFFDLQ
jgi:hypothetical protein